MNSGFFRLIPLVMLTLGACSTPAQREAKFMQSGQDHLAQGDPARAILAFRNAAQLNPKNAAAHHQLAMAHLRRNEIEQALGALAKALEADPNHAPTQRQLAGMLVVSGREDMVQESEKQAQSLVAKDAGNVDALNLLAFAQSRLGKDAEAETQLRESLRRAPGNLNAMLSLALLRIDNGDLAGATKLLRETVEKSPNSPVARTALAALCARTGQPAEAEEHLRRAVQEDAKFAPALFALASLQVRSGQVDRAGETYAKIAALPDPATRSAHAYFLLTHGRVPEGIRELEQLVKAHPTERGYRSLLVSAYFTSGRPAEATALVRDALAKNAKDVDALVQQAALDLQGGKTDAAAPALETALSLSPNLAAAHYLMAEVHGRRDALELRRAALTRAVELDPQFLAARLDLASALLDKATAASALATLDAAPPAQKSAPPVRALRNWALISLGQWAEVDKSAPELLAVGQNEPSALVQNALVRLRRNDFAGARPLLDSALAAAPDDLRVLNALMAWFAMQKRTAAGVEQIRAHAAKHDSAAVHAFAGELLLREGQAKEARQEFDAAVRREPSHTAAALGLARLELGGNGGAVASARAVLEKLLAAKPKSVPARLMLAQADVLEGRFTQAVEIYRAVLTDEPGNVLALNNAASIMVEKLNQADEALALASRAVELQPSDADSRDTLGWVYYTKKLPAAAQPHLEEAAKLKKSAANQYHLAMLYERLGDAARARRHMDTALELDPKIVAAGEAVRQ